MPSREHATRRLPRRKVCLNFRGSRKRKSCSRRGWATTNFLEENLSVATLSCGVGRTRARGEDAAPTSKTRPAPAALDVHKNIPTGWARAPRVFSAEKCARPRKRRRAVRLSERRALDILAPVSQDITNARTVRYNNYKRALSIRVALLSLARPYSHPTLAR